MDSQDAELVQELRDLCVSHAAYSKGIVFGIGSGLRSRLLFSCSPVDRSTEADDQSTCRFIVIRASSIVRIDITSKCAISFSSECSSKTQMSVLHAIEVLKHGLESYNMLIARVVIVPAENSDGICNITPSGGHCIYKASTHRLVNGQIAGFLIGLPPVKLHCHWHGNWSGLIHSELRQDLRNITVLMDIDCVMHPISFHVHAEIQGDTPETTHPEPLLHLVLDVPNQALVSDDDEIINIQNICCNDYALILIVKYDQSSIDRWCYKSNRGHEVLRSAIPNVWGLLQAVMRLSQAE